MSDLPPPGGYPPPPPPSQPPAPPPTPGWWQASDGNWYPPHQHPSYNQAAATAPYTGYSPVQGGTNGLAIASMVLGILWLWWVGSVLAVIFGHVSLSQIRRTNQGGRGMAIAGLVLGYIGIAFLVLGIIAYAIDPDEFE